ncbi:MAG: S-methyl-5'-thioadenosine phosphorylase [Candidatus Omnitrophica bacterium]|nr:S-methyl-5'-thioadenosine phosphorylase [Candidatus Omnitrophota bacterium]
MAGKIGIIGGSGFYNIDGIKKVKKIKVTTPFGSPSDHYFTGVLEGRDVVFLARHGAGHRIIPTEINYRANIYGMKKLGVDQIISISACGSLKKELAPLDIVIPDQLIDRTNQSRRMTFFGEGVVAHIQFADPFCKELSDELYRAGKEVGASMHLGGTYLNMEGPQFSTRAESRLYRQWGVDIIGMTNLGEAKLAREAEICYATMACITDYDCWHMDESCEVVSVDMIIQNLLKNVEVSKNILKKALPKMRAKPSCGCAHALDNAIITRPDAISESAKKKLRLIAGKYLK